MRSPALSPKVAENDLVNQFYHLAWGWGFVRRREFKASASESFEMVATLSLEKMK
jgi:hypothetical protein